MKVSHVNPDFKLPAFTCPYCVAFAHQTWYEVYLRHPNYTDADEHDNLKAVKCAHCRQFSYWHKEKLIFPLTSSIPNPAYEMPDDVKQDYLEARAIIANSPRGSAALLRLALQKLMPSLGETGNNLNNDIANLVKKGLPEKIQRALDYVRVIGNNAVHPGKIDISDDQETVDFLFELINEIVDYMIVKPQKLDALYQKLPNGQLKQIQNRDGSK